MWSTLINNSHLSSIFNHHQEYLLIHYQNLDSRFIFILWDHHKSLLRIIESDLRFIIFITNLIFISFITNPLWESDHISTTNMLYIYNTSKKTKLTCLMCIGLEYVQIGVRPDCCEVYLTQKYPLSYIRYLGVHICLK